MILSVSPNLAIDVTVELDSLTPGAVHRARRVHRQAGGKGVNVARTVSALGERVTVMGLASGTELSERFADEALTCELVPTEAASRTCTILLTPDGRATVVNEPGSRVSDPTPLLERYRERLDEASSVALMGSLQPGLPSRLFAEMVAGARERGLFCVVDTSGDALASAIEAGPSLVIPNRDEAEALLGRALDTVEACQRAAEEIRQRGAALAVVTLGEEGAVLSGPDGMNGRLVRDGDTDMRFGNPTGAGDAFVGGAVVSRRRGFGVVEMLRFGMACAVASLSLGYGRLRQRDVRPEEITYIPRD